MEWLRDNPTLAWWLFAASLAVSAAGLLAVPMLLVRMPADYFVRPEPHNGDWRGRHPALRITLLVLKNAAGALFLVLGLLMLFTPGQGILSMVLGLSLLNLPGKRALERRIVGERHVLAAINALRARAGRPPLDLGPPASR
jgi:hypothetical protein